MGNDMHRLFKALLLIGFLIPTQLFAAPNTFQADASIKVISTIAANNTTAIVLKSTGGTVYSVDAFNNGATIAYIKLYSVSSPSTFTCGTGTPYARYMIPFGASSSGGGFNVSNINGDAYSASIVMCITTGIADADTTAPAASTYIVNVHLK
jgi:hypothetical protein